MFHAILKNVIKCILSHSLKRAPAQTLDIMGLFQLLIIMIILRNLIGWRKSFTLR